MQWIWPIPIAVGVFLAPESPWWLTRKGLHEDAKKALRTLQSKKIAEDTDIDATVAMMVYTYEYEMSANIGSSYSDCFKGIDLRRTEITCIVWAIQNLSGSGFMGYSTYFFQQAGLNQKNSVNIAMAQYGPGAIGTILSWFLMGQFGQRILYLSGLSVQFLVLLITGFLGLAPSLNTPAPWVIATMMIVYTFVYDMTVGPICYALVPEITSGCLRTRTVVLGRNLYNVIAIVMNIIIPDMLNPTAWNLKARAGFFYADFCLLCLVWTFFRLSEPKGRTYGELDVAVRESCPCEKIQDDSC
jgi:MFS transporter, SP family, general alpha glucoside:H+ symporter